MNKGCAQGSLWRKWDLHFHTPASYDHRGIKDSAQIISRLESRELSVVAITDHHVMDVELIKHYQDKSKFTVLPGIELRTDKGGSESVHIIGIFSEEEDVDYLWDYLRVNLNIMEKDVKKRGDDKVYCGLEEACKIIHDIGGVVTIHAGAKSNSIEKITNALPYKMALKAEIASRIDVFEVASKEDVEEYEKIIFPHLTRYFPTIICSDCHNIDKYNVREELWIKAEPCFAGLKQVLVEPKKRICVGKPPVLERVEDNKTKYIDYINIEKVQGGRSENGWFDGVVVHLNPELNSIIGNKGNGKSALADTLGLLGNTKNYRFFSFLNDQKFRKNGKAEGFTAKIVWKSGDESEKKLSVNPLGHEVETIKYIPQQFFEKLCNDSPDDFEVELKKVIFSHISEENRLNALSLDRLLEIRSESLLRDVEYYKDKIKEVNGDIILLERMLQDNYMLHLEALLEEKRREIIALCKRRPVRVYLPKEDSDELEKGKKIQGRIDILRSDILSLEGEISTFRSRRVILLEQSSFVVSFLAKVDDLRRKVQGLIEDDKEKLRDVGLNISEVITLNINDELMVTKQTDIQSEIKIINGKLDKADRFSLYGKIKSKDKAISALSSALGAPQKRYQEYLSIKTEWKSRVEAAVGQGGMEGTFRNIKEKIKYIQSIAFFDLEQLRRQRFEFMHKLYECKVFITDIYKDLYKPVDAFISQYKELTEKYKISLDVNLNIEMGFVDTFLSYINKGVKGSYYGYTEASERIRQMLSNYKVNRDLEFLSFLADVLYSLEVDQREGNKDVKRVIEEQINSKRITEFYDYLFTLDYVKPYYKLKLDEKELSELSPGEKGALLLIFYLILDRGEMPLVIDQPEDNLDNQSVYKILVPFINEAKSRRQIVIVTHNPNLAVVCDSELVVCTSIDKINHNNFSFISGAIENKDINDRIVEILEGTMPAFSNRDMKYGMSEGGVNVARITSRSIRD